MHIKSSEATQPILEGMATQSLLDKLRQFYNNITQTDDIENMQANVFRILLGLLGVFLGVILVNKIYFLRAMKLVGVV